jgi:quercetin dioxygenase-like cupin family protein
LAEGKAHGGAFHIPAGEGESVWVVGERVTFKATSQDTGGAFSLTEEMWPPQVGPPPHIHHTQDETFYVLEGEMEFVTEGRTTTRATAGSFVLDLPRGGGQFLLTPPQPPSL